MVMIVMASIPSCIDLPCLPILPANPQECRLSVGLGIGDRASISLITQQAMLHQYPQCTVFSAYPELPSALCGASNEIIAHVVMDADILYFRLFPRVHSRHWLDHHAWREVKGFM